MVDTTFCFHSEEEFLCVCCCSLFAEPCPGPGKCLALCWDHRGTMVSTLFMSAMNVSVSSELRGC